MRSWFPHYVSLYPGLRWRNSPVYFVAAVVTGTIEGRQYYGQSSRSRLGRFSPVSNGKATRRVSLGAYWKGGPGKERARSFWGTQGVWFQEKYLWWERLTWCASCGFNNVKIRKPVHQSWNSKERCCFSRLWVGKPSTPWTIQHDEDPQWDDRNSSHVFPHCGCRCSIELITWTTANSHGQVHAVYSFCSLP